MATTMTEKPTGASQEPLTSVGMIGPTSVGKTTYFAVLDRALQDRGWTVEVGGIGKNTPEQRAFGEELLRNVRVNGKWPQKTKATNPKPDRLSMRISNHVGVEVALSFYDPAGELFDPRREPREYERERDQVFNHMRDCKGILILLDPHMPQQHLVNTWELSVGAFRSYVRSNNLTHLVQGNKIVPRVAVLLTKADRLPFLRRHRTRGADLWMRNEGGLEGLVTDMRRTCQEVEFYFSSALGWKDGAENCRTYVVPRRLSQHDSTEGGQPGGDLIPDPPQPTALAGHSHGPARLAQTSLPLFRDPLQVADHRSPDPALAERPEAAGVLVYPGREPPSRTGGSFVTPWNVVEPLLWAAGVSPTGTKTRRGRA